VTIAGVRAGGLIGPDDAAIATEECPVARAAGLDWRLQPAAFRLPGLGFEMPSEAIEPGFQERLAGFTADAFEIIARMRPELQPAFESVARVLAFKTPDSADYTNLTHSELPGSFVCSAALHPYDLADTLVHEFHHNLLYALEEDSPFFEPGTEAIIAYYSPWRSDIRDLHGVLHAMYVYVAATWYWLAVHRSGEATGDLADYTVDRLVRYPLQLRIGEAVLDDNARWTDHGRDLFERLRAERSAIDAAVAVAGIPFDASAVTCNEEGEISSWLEADGRPQTARDSVRWHLDSFDSGGSGRAALLSHGIDL